MRRTAPPACTTGFCWGTRITSGSTVSLAGDRARVEVIGLKDKLGSQSLGYDSVGVGVAPLTGDIGDAGPIGQVRLMQGRH